MIYRLISLTLLFLFSTIGISVSSAQQEYQIPEIRIEAEILSNGNVWIQESREYRFQGSFSWADYRLPRKGFDEMNRILVREGDQIYSLSDTEEPGTFSVSQSSGEVIIKWNYSAADTTRIFTLSYELAGAIPHGEQWSEFFWTWIGSGREKSTDRFFATITFPQIIPADSLYFWSRAPADMVRFEHDGAQLSFSAEKVARSQSLPVRILMPVSLFNPDTITEREPGIEPERIIAEEDEIADKALRRAERRAALAELAPGLTILLSLISIGIFIALYRKYGKRYKTKTLSSVSTTMIPDGAGPALVGRLLSFYQTQPIHLTATLFDLARRGWFTLEEKQSQKKWYQSKTESEFIIAATEPSPKESLPEWERMTVDFINSRLLLDKSKLSEVFSGSDSTAMKWYPKWSKSVASAFREQNWKDQESLKGVYLNLFLQVPILVISILLTIFGSSIGLAAFIVSVIMLASTGAIIRRTKEGEETWLRWRAYRDGLKDTDERILFKGNLDRHFVYAIAFGLREKQLTRLIDLGSQNRDTGLFPWLLIAPGSGSTPVTAAQNLVKHSTLSATSGGVAGGGASVGSAGGGARGGAG